MNSVFTETMLGVHSFMVSGHTQRSHFPAFLTVRLGSRDWILVNDIEVEELCANFGAGPLKLLVQSFRIYFPFVKGLWRPHVTTLQYGLSLKLCEGKLPRKGYGRWTLM